MARLVFATFTFSTPQPGHQHTKKRDGETIPQWLERVNAEQRALFLAGSNVIRNLMCPPTPEEPWRVGDIVDSYVRVAEFRKDERTGKLKENSLHFHMLFVMRDPVGEGFNHERYFEYLKCRQLKLYGKANALKRELGQSAGLKELEARLRLAKKTIARRNTPMKLGLFEVRPCYGDNANGPALYLAKYISKDGERPETARGLRMVTYSRNWGQNHTDKFMLVKGRSADWRAQGKAFSRALGIPHEEMASFFGPRWSFRVKDLLRVMNVFDDAGTGLAGLSDVEKSALALECAKAGRVPDRLMIVKPEGKEGRERPWRYEDEYAYNLDQVWRWFEENWDKPKNTVAKRAELSLLEEEPF